MLASTEQREPDRMSGVGEGPDYEAICAEARGRWPGIELAPDAFRVYVRDRLRPEDTDPTALHLDDLYFACACVQGARGAVEMFERRYLPGVRVAVCSIDSSPTFLDEVTQLLRERVFVAGKLASYSGRGPLETWLAVASHRIGLSLKRRQRIHDEPFEEALAVLVPEDPELTYFKSRYRQEFQAALSAAMAGLSERQQLILRLTLRKGVSHARIAAMYGVNQSTVTRWVTGARRQIWEELRQQLSRRLRMGSGEVDSLIRFMKSDPQLTLSQALEQSSE
jgi:RNA polymerase sigma-70 factor (ECF subfamily)